MATEIDAFARRKRAFKDFLDPQTGVSEFRDVIRLMLDQGETRLPVDLDVLQRDFPDLANGIMQHPIDYIPPFEEALQEVAITMRPSLNKETTSFHIGLEGSFGAHFVSPRGLSASLLGKMVCSEGIVTKVSTVRPKVIRSVHYCPNTDSYWTKEYRDSTCLAGEPTSSTYPTKDESGNPLQTEFGLSQYKDYQSITIQEMPEKAPTGQMPCSVDVMLEYDLVDKVKPGDRVHVSGIYRALSSISGGSTTGVFRVVILANSVRVIGKEVQALVMTLDDIKNIKKIAERKDVVDLLGRSVAPSIYGHEYIKKSLLLQLLGGIEHNLESGTHLRGDINLLMVGDPSVAKSQLMRAMMRLAPLAVSTTGRGTSGVGLTAAVSTDKETGERRLEAGAMVLADRGIVCIDEFDKMSDADRVAIHEVMEQQTITINKAGIHASLNARCSVLAAANPAYGQYDRKLSVQKNIALPDSLLSRFDLLFVVLDTMDPEVDRKVADHVLRMHRYQRPGYEGVPIPLDAASLEDAFYEAHDEQEFTPIFEKFNPLLHGGSLQEAKTQLQRRLRKKQQEESKLTDVVSLEFLKKYIHYAKNRIKPRLSDTTCQLIAETYADLRRNPDVAVALTARTLETLIRLCCAHAKCRLSHEVTEEDCESAKDILMAALFSSPLQKPQRNEIQENEFDESDIESKSEHSTPNAGRKQRKRSESLDSVGSNASRKRSIAGSSKIITSDEMDEMEDILDDVPKDTIENRADTPRVKRARRIEEEEDEEKEIHLERNSERFRTFRTALSRYLRNLENDDSSLEEVLTAVNCNSIVETPFSVAEAKAILKMLDEDSTIMFRDNRIYPI